MENKEYLTEENYQKSNEKVKKVGKILIIIGLSLLGLGVINLLIGLFGIGGNVSNMVSSQVNNSGDINPSGVNSGFDGIFSSVGFIAIGGMLSAPGFFLTIAGLVVRFAIGNRREIAAYTTQQVMPVAKEGIEKMTPTVGNAVGSISKEIAKGIREGINEADSENKE